MAGPEDANRRHDRLEAEIRAAQAHLAEHSTEDSSDIGTMLETLSDELTDAARHRHEDQAARHARYQSIEDRMAEARSRLDRNLTPPPEAT